MKKFTSDIHKLILTSLTNLLILMWLIFITWKNLLMLCGSHSNIIR